MPYTSNGRIALTGGLSAVVTHLSLHTGDPGTGGANEVAGGGYARQAVTWVLSGSSRVSVGSAAFSVPAATTVLHVGFWSALTAGSFYGYAPLGALLAGVATALSTSEVLTSYNHGLADGNAVLVSGVAGAALPGGLVAGTAYYVIASTTSTFQLAATPGGVAINVTSSEDLIFQRVVPEAFGGAGTLTLPAGSVSISVNLA